MKKNLIKDKAYIWIPCALAIYTAIMAWTFRDAVTVHHDYLPFFASLGAEAVILVALFFFLRKRIRLRKEREERDKR